MSTEIVNVVFTVDANMAKFRSELRGAQASVQALQKQIGVLNAGQLETLRTTFRDAMVASGQFHHAQVDLENSTLKWGRALEKQKLSFTESISAMQNYRRESGKINRIAKENLKMQQSVVASFGKTSKGTVPVEVLTNQAAQLETVGQRADFAAHRFRALTAVMNNASTSMVNWGKNTQWAGRQIMVGLTVPIAMFGAAAAMTFKKVDEELTRITKVYGDGSMNINKEAIRKQAMENARFIAQTYGQAQEETLSLTADLAAVGYTGNKLNESVIQTTRLMVLGEVDRQQAMKTTLALQSAFNVSARETADAINFMNAVENQTSTSLEDLTEAFPRAGTVVKGLGGDFKDLALYITAMREGGIGAAEGANAIKSGLSSIITPSKEANNFVKDLGINLDEIRKQGGGDLTKTLFILQGQLKNLNKDEYAEVMSKLFGKHQMGRMMALFNNLNTKGSQTRKVLKLMRMDAEELEQLASGEIQAVSESASGQFKRAWESLRVEIGMLGEKFLKVGTSILNFFNKIIKPINNLSEGAKTFLTVMAMGTAAVGPIIMLAGIFGNFLGNLAKGVTMMRKFYGVTRGIKGNFEVWDATKAAEESEAMSTVMRQGAYQSEKSMNALTEAIKRVNAALKDMEVDAATVFVPGQVPSRRLTMNDIVADPNIRGIAPGLMGADYNLALADKDPTESYMRVLKGQETRGALTNLMATERVLLPFMQSGDPEQIGRALKGRVRQEYTTSTGQQRQADYKDFRTLQLATDIPIEDKMTIAKQHVARALNISVDQFDQLYRKHMEEINAELKIALQKGEAGLEQYIRNSVLTTSGALQKATTYIDPATGQRVSYGAYTSHPSSIGSSLAYASGADILTGPLHNPQSTSLEEMERMQKEAVERDPKARLTHGGHVAPAGKSVQYYDAYIELTQQQAMILQDEIDIENKKLSELNKSLASMKEFNSLYEKYQSAITSGNAEEQKILRQKLEARAKELGIVLDSSLDEQKFNAQAQAAQVKILENIKEEEIAAEKLAANVNAHGREMAIINEQIEAAARERLIAEEKAATQTLVDVPEGQTGRGRMQTISRGVGTAGMALSMLPMMTGMGGGVGDALGKVGMGASLGMMFGPWGALGGGLLGGYQALFDNLNKEAGVAAGALEMGSIAADTFGLKLQDISNAGIDPFIEKMTNNTKAADKSVEALNRFREALRNAEPGSPEADTVNRLKDLAGGNSKVENVLGTGMSLFSKAANLPFGTQLMGSLAAPYIPGANLAMPWLAKTAEEKNPQDLNPEQTIQGILTQKYTEALVSGASKRQASIAVQGYAEESGVTNQLEGISDELAKIETSSQAIDALASKLESLRQPGQTTKDLMRDVFNPKLVYQMSFKEMPALENALSSAGMSWEDYMNAMAEGNDEQKAFATKINSLKDRIGVDIPTAVDLAVAKMSGLPVAYNDFIGKSREEVETILGRIQRNADADARVNKFFKSAQKKINLAGGERSEQASADRAAAAQKANQEEIEAMQDASEKRIKAMEEASQKHQEQMQDEIESVQKRYDKEIKKVQDLDNARQKSFDREQALQQRAQQGRSMEIDYMRAMDEGRYYDAAAIQNDFEMQQKQWRAEDVRAAQEEKAVNKIDALTSERDKKLEFLNTQLEDQKKADQEALEQQREADQKRIEQAQKANDAIVADTKTAAEAEMDVQKEVYRQLIEAGKKGKGAFKKVMEDYGLSHKEAMSIIATNSGITGAKSAKLVGQGFHNADWQALTDYIGAVMDKGANSEKAKEAYKRFEASIKEPTIFSKLGNAADSIFNMNVQKRAHGGYISGSGTATSDSIPAKLSNGEYVVRASAVKKIGVGKLHQINQGNVPGFADGGSVGYDMTANKMAVGALRSNAIWESINSRIKQKIQDKRDARAAAAAASAGAAGDGISVPLKFYKGLGKTSSVLSSAIPVGSGRTYSGSGNPHRVGWQDTPAWGVVDIGSAGMKVFSYAAGKVAHAGPYPDGDYSPGSTVEVWHKNGGKTRYAHLQWLAVKVGDMVRAGQRVGTSGSDHLHFEWTGMPTLHQRGPGEKAPWLKAATGGYIYGSGGSTSDSIPAMVSNGEYVVQAKAVKKIGIGKLHQINNGNIEGFKDGGPVKKNKFNQSESTMAGSVLQSPILWSTVIDKIQKRIDAVEVKGVKTDTKTDSTAPIKGQIPPPSEDAAKLANLMENRLGKSTIHGHSVDGQCLKNVNDLWQYEVGRAVTRHGLAKDQGYAIMKAGQMNRGDYNAPRGTLYWWNGPNAAGHVAVSDGSGRAMNNYASNIVVRPEARKMAPGNYMGWSNPGAQRFAAGGKATNKDGLQNDKNKIKKSTAEKDARQGIEDGTFKFNLPKEGPVTGMTSTMAREMIKYYAKLGIAAKQASANASVNSGTSDTKFPDVGTGDASDFGTPGSAKSLWNVLRANGYDSIHAAAILGHLQQESGFNPNATNPNGGAFGLAQWYLNRKIALLNWLKKNDYKPNSWEGQIKYLLRELKAGANSFNNNVFLKKKSVPDATSYLRTTYGWGRSNNYDHSQDDEAAIWLKKFGGKGFATGGLVIPQLRKGAVINYDNTLANLHRGEAVLTAPLTQKLRDNVDNGVASGGDINYNVTVTIDRASATAAEIDKAITGSLERHAARVGRARRR